MIKQAMFKDDTLSVFMVFRNITKIIINTYFYLDEVIVYDVLIVILKSLMGVNTATNVVKK